MKIVIEGCDGVGKTTVCRELAKIYNCDLLHFTGEDPRTVAFYTQTLLKNNVVFDRHCISELVYSTIYERELKVKINDVKKIIREHPDAHFFILHTDPAVIEARLKNRGDDEDKTVLDNLQYLTAKYITLAKELNVPIIDTSHIALDEAVSMLCAIIDHDEQMKGASENE